mmetsp:Transcript_56013/g.156081  ORF Transcript_56013/g.156081 Transcript_56013/m.156081 type:complete len:206 (+) Transcript_56013:271-888(+)
MATASSLAAVIMSSLDKNTLETKPKGMASLATKSRPEKANSLTRDWLPTIFGKRCKPPTSAARPMSNSFKANTASSVQKRTSAAEINSTPAPMHALCTQAMTTLPHFSMFEKASCHDFPMARMRKAMCAASASSLLLSWKAAKSTPAQKRFPAPVRMTTRIVPSQATAPKKSRISSHISTLNALRFSGRFKRHSTIPGSRDTASK